MRRSRSACARRPALASERRRDLRTVLLRMPQYAPRPPHLWPLVLAFGLSGLVLLAIAATQI